VVAYAGAGTEPPVAELLDDAITQTLIASDRVRPEDGVAHASRCPASPQRTLLAENLGKPSL